MANEHRTRQDPREERKVHSKVSIGQQLHVPQADWIAGVIKKWNGNHASLSPKMAWRHAACPHFFL